MPEARLEVTKTFLENIDPDVNAFLNESSLNSLKTAYSILVEKYGRRETETGFNEFVSAIDEISIAQTEACSGPSPLRVSDTTRLVQEYNAASAAKNAHLQRSIVGKLLCVDSNVTASPVPIRGRRQLKKEYCPPDPCTCPPDGDILCPCEFFKCLDPDDVLKSILGFKNNQECLAFVIDTTGSMTNEIDAAREIILNFLRSEEEIGILGCYALVPFNDIGPDNATVADEKRKN